MRERSPTAGDARADAALDLPLSDLAGRSATLREHLADPLLVFVWGSW